MYYFILENQKTTILLHLKLYCLQCFLRYAIFRATGGCFVTIWVFSLKELLKNIVKYTAALKQ